MLKPAKVEVSDLGDRQHVIPAQDPPLRLTVGRIPISQTRSMGRIIPVCEPTMAGREREYLIDCIESGWISSAGKYIERFERMFAEKIGVREAVTTTNGTTSIHLALAALGIGPGDEVIVPTFTMIATAHAVTHLGATPVLVDADERTWNMSVAEIAKKITPRTKAIVPVHIYGFPCDMDEINEVAARHNVWVVEDAAESHGARYKGRMTGALGIMASFSFYANKIITTGEGGMITTDNAELAALCRTLRDHAFSKERHFWHRYHGYNYRMSNMQAAVGCAQMERFDELTAARTRNAQRYIRNLTGIDGITLPPTAGDRDNVYWMFGIRVDQGRFGMSRDELRRYLADRAVETRTFFVPMHLQPVYFRQFEGQRYPVAERLCGDGMYLPSASKLTDEEIDFVCDCIRDAAAEKRR